jgi:hypothetical protein
MIPSSALSLSRFRICHRGCTGGTMPVPFLWEAESMNMSHSAPTEDRFQMVEMIPSGTAIAAFPAGAIAQAWLEEYSQQLTWADLITWLRGSRALS